MRIISNYHDYYDSARSFGADPRLVYVRETKEIQNPNKDIADVLRSILQKMPRWDRGAFGVIAFCGRAFPFYTYEGKAAYDIQELKRLISTIPTYSPDSAKSALQGLDRVDKKKRSSWWYRDPWWHRGDLTTATWEHFKKNVDLSVSDEFFRTLSAPVVLMQGRAWYDDSNVLILNPRLNQYNFATQKDPFTAYQELAMFLGNNMATQMDPEVHIPDEIRAQSHGFDKWSFRKRKGQ